VQGDDGVHVVGLTDWPLPSRFRDIVIDRKRKRREDDHPAQELRVLCVAMTPARAEGPSKADPAIIRHNTERHEV
jgi:hypothetical protein